MNIAFCLIMIALAFVGLAPAQDNERETEAAQIRSLVQGFGTKPTAVELMLRSTYVLKGKAVSDSDDRFVLQLNNRYRGPKGKPVIAPIQYIQYKNVLWIKGGGRSVSVVPDPNKRPHGTWQDVKAVNRISRVAILLANGKWSKGWFDIATDRSLVFFGDKEGRLDVPPEDLRAIYIVMPGSGGFVEGASSASDIPTRAQDSLISGAAALVGGMFGLALKKNARLILIYSK